MCYSVIFVRELIKFIYIVDCPCGYGVSSNCITGILSIVPIIFITVAKYSSFEFRI